MRYSISKFRDFSGIFINILETLSDFEHIYKNTPPNFEAKIYINIPLIFEVKIKKKAPQHL